MNELEHPERCSLISCDESVGTSRGILSDYAFNTLVLSDEAEENVSRTTSLASDDWREEGIGQPLDVRDALALLQGSEE